MDNTLLLCLTALIVYKASHNYSFHTFGLGLFESVLGGKGSFLKIPWQQLLWGLVFKSKDLNHIPYAWTFIFISCLLPYMSIVAIDVSRKYSLEKALGDPGLSITWACFLQWKEMNDAWLPRMLEWLDQTTLVTLCYSIRSQPPAESPYHLSPYLHDSLSIV